MNSHPYFCVKKRIIFAFFCCSVFFLSSSSAQNGRPKNDKGFIIGSDDIMMLNTPARGAEALACCPFARSRTFRIDARKSAQVAWKEAKVFGKDTLRLLRVEILRADVSVAKFTLLFYPKTVERAASLRCMKGFGCAGTWEVYPWKSPDGNFLEHPQFHFKVAPNNHSYFTIYNLDKKEPMTVRINPCEDSASPSPNPHKQ